MSRKKSKGEEVDAALRAMFETLEKRPVPGRLRSVADQLDETDAALVDKAQRRSGH